MVNLIRGAKSLKEKPSEMHFASSFQLLSTVTVAMLVQDLPSDRDLCVQDELQEEEVLKNEHDEVKQVY